MSTPPGHEPPVFQLLFDLTVEWHSVMTTFPKRDRYSLGERIFSSFVDGLLAVQAGRFQQGAMKMTQLTAALRSVNTTLVLVRLTNSIGVLPDKKYFALSQRIVEAKNMLGGWLKSHSLRK